MLYMRPGEDPEWTLIRDRERLVFTDPPMSPHPRRSSRSVPARAALILASVLAITAIPHPDSASADVAAIVASCQTWVGGAGRLLLPAPQVTFAGPTTLPVGGTTSTASIDQPAP